MSCLRSNPALRSILEVLQEVADFVSQPATFDAQDAAALIVEIEALRGAIQALPVDALTKADLNDRLSSAQTVLQNFITGTDDLEALDVLLAVLALLELVKQKVLLLGLKPCEGRLSVCFPKPFSTACDC